MSIINSNAQADKFAIPHEANEWIELRPLSYFAEQEAGNVYDTEQMAKMNGVDPDVVEALTRNAEKPEEVEKPPSERCDKVMLLTACLVSWSYDEPLEEANIKLLDVPTFGFIISKIDEMNFRSPESGKE